MKNQFRNKNEFNQFIMSHLSKVIVETYLCRISLYLRTLILAVSAVMLAIISIDYVMMIGHNFNAPEYNWLAITAYIVMNVGLVAILSKFIIHRFSLLCEKDEELES